MTRRDQKFGVNRDHARSKPGARQRDASPRPAPSKPYWLPRSDEVQERAAAGRKPAVGEFLDPGGGPGGHERTAVSAPRAKKGGMATYQVDGGGAIGFRNSPNPKDMANVAKAPPAPPLSKWVATAEKEGWIQTKVEGQTLWLPTQYMDKLKLEAKPPPTAAGGSEAAAAKSYTCLKKCQVRAGFAADSDKAMILTPGTVIEVLAARPNESGVLRIQFSGGWVNERTGAGVVCLEPAAPALAPAPASATAPAADPAEVAAAAAAALSGGGEEAKLGTMAEEAAAKAAAEAALAAPPSAPTSEGADLKGDALLRSLADRTQWLATQAANRSRSPSPTASQGAVIQGPATAAEMPAEPEPEPEPELAVAKSYTCLKKCQVRAGFAADSDKAMILTPGTVIEVLAARPNESGVLRIQFSGGWVNERTGAGVVCLELASLPKPTDGQPAGLIPSPSAAEPVPEPSPVRAAKKKPYVKGKVVLVDYTTPDLVRSSRMCVSRMCTSNVRHSNRSMLMPPWGRCRWIWLGNDSWSQVFVTLDCYGNLCTFHDEDSTNPAALVRPEEARPEDAPQALIKHPHSFVVKGSVVGERLKTPAPTKIVLEPTEAQPGNQTSPTESVEQEAQVEELIPTPFRLSHAA